MQTSSSSPSAAGWVNAPAGEVQCAAESQARSRPAVHPAHFEAENKSASQPASSLITFQLQPMWQELLQQLYEDSY